MGFDAYQTVATPYLREVRTGRRVSERDLECLVCECAADTFVAVEHVDDRSSIRFGLVACECDDGTCSLCASVRFSSREELDAWKWVERERGGGNVD